MLDAKLIVSQQHQKPDTRMNGLQAASSSHIASPPFSCQGPKSKGTKVEFGHFQSSQ